MKLPVLAVPAAIVWAVSWFASSDERFVPAEPPDWVWATRDAFATSVSRWGGDGAALTPGLVLGDTRAISDSLESAMRVSSLSHLTAVSGANCAIVVAALYGFVALLGGALWLRLVVSAAGLCLFVVVVGFEPSIIRAAIMAVIALLAIAWGRTVAGLTVLSATVTIALLVLPSLSRSMGFALSVAATAGILILVTPLTQIFERVMPRALATAIAVSSSAGLAVQPLLLVFAPVVSAYGIVGNILVTPLVPLATVAGLIGVVLSWSPLVSSPFTWVAWLCASGIAAIARFFAGLPGASVPWPNGPAGIALSVLVTVLVAGSILRRNGTLAIVAGATVFIAVSTTVGGTFIRWLGSPSDWSWAQCDVGQGDAVVVRDGDATVLIDTGRDSAQLRDCLSKLGIARFDMVVLTHFDIDHVGAVATVVGNTPLMVHGPLDGARSDNILSDFHAAGARVESVCRGDGGRVGRLVWRVLWPTCHGSVEPGNPASVVVAFDRGPQCDSSCVTGVALGDLGEAEQTALMAIGRPAGYDIVKVSHHGSRDQSARLYDRIGAPVALIGVGAGNEYGHPHRDTLAALASAGSTVLRSDLAGIVLVGRGTDGVLSVWSERSQ